jgi:hypothetical protein
VKLVYTIYAKKNLIKGKRKNPKKLDLRKKKKSKNIRGHWY